MGYAVHADASDPQLRPFLVKGLSFFSISPEIKLSTYTKSYRAEMLDPSLSRDLSAPPLEYAAYLRVSSLVIAGYECVRDLQTLLICFFSLIIEFWTSWLYTLPTELEMCGEQHSLTRLTYA